MAWFVAGFGIGFMVGIYIYRYFTKRRKSEMTTEDCVEMLKNKGYWVNLNMAPKKEKGGN